MPANQVRKTKGNSKFGNLPGPGPGRPKGSSNQNTRLLKDAILMAAEAVGENGKGLDGLLGFLKAEARKPNNSGFMGLLKGVLPIQIANQDGEAFKTDNVFRIEFVKPDKPA